MAENYQRIFGENGGKTAISDVDYDNGWDFIGDQPPEVEDFNSVMNEQDLKIAEIHREGVVTYDATTDYAATTNDITKGSDGNLYLCSVNSGPGSTPVDPVGDTTGAWVAITGKESKGSVFIDTLGPTSFTVPHALRSGSKTAKVTVVSGGGGAARDGANSAGGGGGGAKSIIYGLDLTAIASVSVNVGDGGAGSLSSTASNGGASSFGAYMSCTGGLYGGPTAGGVSGMAAGGDYNEGLGDGANSNTDGGGAPSGGVGGGAGGKGTNGTGNDARGYGGGGGGGTSLSGGDGFQGYVLIEW
tara:strand:+ start:3715 stop:4617 length:903 start_codon:yes stop_codon:yes gene_type:complete